MTAKSLGFGRSVASEHGGPARVPR